MIYLNRICKILEAKTCREHNERPKATVNGMAINVSTCCNKFQLELHRNIEMEVARQATEARGGVLRN